MLRLARRRGRSPRAVVTESVRLRPEAHVLGLELEAESEADGPRVRCIPALRKRRPCELEGLRAERARPATRTGGRSNEPCRFRRPPLSPPGGTPARSTGSLAREKSGGFPQIERRSESRAKVSSRRCGLCGQSGRAPGWRRGVRVRRGGRSRPRARAARRSPRRRSGRRSGRRPGGRARRTSSRRSARGSRAVLEDRRSAAAPASSSSRRAPSSASSRPSGSSMPGSRAV